MQPLKLSLIVVLGGGLLAAGCSDEVELKPCPSGGLGVKSLKSGKLCKGILDPDDPDLKNCNQQMLDWEQYDCSEPQICPDQGSYRLPIYYHDPMYRGDPLSFSLKNCSTGNKTLTLTKILLTGDSNCSFVFENEKHVESLEIKPGEDSVVQAVYKPKGLTEDHAAFRITSNAQNIPELVLPMCARSVPKYVAGMDSGMPGGVDGGLPEDWICKDVGDQVAACHQ